MKSTEDGANKSSNKMEIVCILLLGVIELDLYNIYRNIYNYPYKEIILLLMWAESRPSGFIFL